jgi:CRISPR/Cas system-associated protein Cas5 (RAMP superfamily)
LEIYRVTRIRSKPRFHQNKKETGLKSEKSMLAIVRTVKAQNNSRAAHGMPPAEVLTIERAEIGEFIDVTDQFI